MQKISRFLFSPNDPETVYIRNGRIPWSDGYHESKHRFIAKALQKKELIKNFTPRGNLPGGYGFGFDERVVEYPWFFANADPKLTYWLDAGSVFNHRSVLENKFWNDKHLIFFTRFSETNFYAGKNFSYQYGDLRNLPFRNGQFDGVVSLSTLEHVGMDNSTYSRTPWTEALNPDAFRAALLEIHRVLSPGGEFLWSVPFGKYQNWKTFQQFDAKHLEIAARCFQPAFRQDQFFRYGKEGWRVSNQEDCSSALYSEYTATLFDKKPEKNVPSDLAAGARAVACLLWRKGLSGA